MKSLSLSIKYYVYIYKLRFAGVIHGFWPPTPDLLCVVFFSSYTPKFFTLNCEREHSMNIFFKAVKILHIFDSFKMILQSENWQSNLETKWKRCSCFIPSSPTVYTVTFHVFLVNGSAAHISLFSIYI